MTSIRRTPHSPPPRTSALEGVGAVSTFLATTRREVRLAIPLQSVEKPSRQDQADARRDGEPGVQYRCRDENGEKHHRGEHAERKPEEYVLCHVGTS